MLANKISDIVKLFDLALEALKVSIQEVPQQPGQDLESSRWRSGLQHRILISAADVS